MIILQFPLFSNSLRLSLSTYHTMVHGPCQGVGRILNLPEIHSVELSAVLLLWGTLWLQESAFNWLQLVGTLTTCGNLWQLKILDKAFSLCRTHHHA